MHTLSMAGLKKAPPELSAVPPCKRGHVLQHLEVFEMGPPTISP